MKKNQSLRNSVVALLVSVSPSVAFADCLDAYRSEVNRLSMVAKAGQVATVNSAAGAGLATGVMYAASAVAFPPLILAGSGAVVSGARLLIMRRQLRSKGLVLRLIEQAEAGEGRLLNRPSRRLSNRNEKITVSEVAHWVREANRSEAFCTLQGQESARKLMNFRQVMKTAGADLDQESLSLLENDLSEKDGE